MFILSFDAPFPITEIRIERLRLSVCIHTKGRGDDEREPPATVVEEASHPDNETWLPLRKALTRDGKRERERKSPSQCFDVKVPEEDRAREREWREIESERDRCEREMKAALT